MRIWLLQRGEPVPTDGDAVRLMRTGILASLLAARGHKVVWWTSTFDHVKKQHRFHRDTTVEIGPGLRIKFLHSIGYRRNISVARMINNRGVARGFAALAPGEVTPDIILSSLPTIELSAAAVRYGERCGIPVIIDVRDLWPDIFLDVIPSGLRCLGRLVLRPLAAQTRFALKHVTGVVAVSQHFLRWGLQYAGRHPGPYDVVFPLGYQKSIFTEDQLRAAAVALHRQGVDSSKVICWFVGMFGRVYDVATVIHAARELARREVRNVQFVLSGDGDQRRHWVDLAKGLNNVVFTGWIDSAQIGYMMSIADIGLIAVNCTPGTMPNKLFEYFSAGLPVLSSLQGEAATLIEEHKCGLSYKAGDPASFVGALTTLLTDEERRRRMGENARRLYEAHYTVDAVYSKMADFLERAATELSPGGRSCYTKATQPLI